jgi:hypothetical protein
MEDQGPIEHQLTFTYDSPVLIMCGIHKYISAGNPELEPTKADYQWHAVIDYGTSKPKTRKGDTGGYKKIASRRYPNYDQCALDMNIFLSEELHDIRE